jgi:prepilin peptidase CpaA
MSQNAFKLFQFGILDTDIIDAILVIFLIQAACFDIKSRRIPNKLVGVGFALSLSLHICWGSDPFSAWGLGLLLGFGMLFPLYLVRAMGAGDVKLMAMAGAFLGPTSAFGAVLMTLIAGGALSIAVAMWNGAFLRAVSNVHFMLTHSIVKLISGIGPQLETPPASAGNVPYAIAIAVGTVAELLLERSGHRLF